MNNVEVVVRTGSGNEYSTKNFDITVDFVGVDGSIRSKPTDITTIEHSHPLYSFCWFHAKDTYFRVIAQASAFKKSLVFAGDSVESIEHIKI